MARPSSRSSVLVGLTQIWEGDDRMGKSGISQFQIGAGIAGIADFNGNVQLDDGGVIQANPVKTAVNPVPRYQCRRWFPRVWVSPASPVS